MLPTFRSAGNQCGALGVNIGVELGSAGGTASAAPGRWNHNTFYYPVLLREVPPGSRRAMDVGCGEGTLTRQLRHLVPEVWGIDADGPSVNAARQHPEAGDITYINDDVLTHAFVAGSFDFISTVAVIHHMEAETALVKLKLLLRPGGVLAIVGCARSSPRDWPTDIAAILPNRLRRLRAPYWHHTSPIVWPPQESYSSMRRTAARLLPGARFQRRLYWRYTIIWQKPTLVGEP